MSKEKNVIVIGCSRLGANLASHLSVLGRDVTIIDKNEIAFRKLSDDFSGYTFVGDAENIETLMEARVDKAHLVIAVTNKDNVNLMITEICSRIFKVEKVLCRLQDSSKEILCEQFNINFIDTSKLSVLEFEKVIGGLL